MAEGSTDWGMLGSRQGGMLSIVPASSSSISTDEFVQQTWPIMKAGYKLWPAVNLVQHVFIPVEQKTVVGSLVGLGWGVYLALFAAQ